MSRKYFLLFICLHLYLIGHITAQRFVKTVFCTINLFFLFICLLMLLIFHFKHVLREVHRLVMTEPVFSMHAGFKALKLIWAFPITSPLFHCPLDHLCPLCPLDQICLNQFCTSNGISKYFEHELFNTSNIRQRVKFSQTILIIYYNLANMISNNITFNK